MYRYLCDRCGLIPADQTTITEVEDTYHVKGAPITVRVPVRICSECGEWLSDDELDEYAQDVAFRFYREQKGIITPEDLVAMRESFGLSQRSFAALLGWGEATIHRYENGSLPDEGHNRILCFFRDPVNLAPFVEMYVDTLPEKAQALARKHLGTRHTEVNARNAVSAGESGFPFPHNYDLPRGIGDGLRGARNPITDPQGYSIARGDTVCHG